MDGSRVFDAHTHLHKHATPEDALNRALANGVTDMLVCGTSPDDWEAVRALCAAHPSTLYPNLGVHPWYAGAAGPPSSWVGALEAALRATPRCGVGECGLDFSPRGLAQSSEAVQVAALRAQLALAAALRLPVSLHCVRAHRSLLDEVAALAAAGDAGLPRGLILHSWAGRPVDAARLQALLPCVFSFSGGLVASAARQLAGGERTPGCASRDTLASLSAVPPEARALETDAPDQPFCAHLTPQLLAAWGVEGAGGDSSSATKGSAPAPADAAAAAEAAGSSASGSSIAAGAPPCCATPSSSAQNSPEHLFHIARAAVTLLHGPEACSAALVHATASSATQRLQSFFARD